MNAEMSDETGYRLFMRNVSSIQFLKLVYYHSQIKAFLRSQDRSLNIGKRISATD